MYIHTHIYVYIYIYIYTHETVQRSKRRWPAAPRLRRQSACGRSACPGRRGYA